jgi:ketosteroid isomerase-like protein
MPNKNVQVVKDAYEAFKTGNMDGLFGAMTSDIDWESIGRRSDFPSLGSWKGLANAKEFFRVVGETLEFHAFSPREFHAVGDLVFAFGSYEMTVRKTGRRIASEFLHAFWVKSGKVTRFREFTDTARFAEAWKG